ncbi:hypothetical protein HB952_06630 [Listeria welshimeri]|uniref:hypothetical protein n=1 Tax=Listeria welshimeri TaxID=1643 RepID=UPI00162853BF|nr:hypothetical protein [Listeria welshimeri]MBC1341588.1 hypothetical protein [Listeria welshimeri]MBC1347475.1 hypothetical protein [Listeria welshimeri]MBC1362440.1 hypothetical protein [Listeria welshimeri]MBC1363861.1 hypothetical protein [Listeria welshimeri]MBC1390175.1 hypothetical protein [Listeria welshimeri]
MRYQKISFTMTSIMAVVVGYLIFTSNYRLDIPNWLLFLFLVLSIAVAVSQWKEKHLIWSCIGLFVAVLISVHYILTI